MSGSYDSTQELHVVALSSSRLCNGSNQNGPAGIRVATLWGRRPSLQALACCHYERQVVTMIRD